MNFFERNKTWLLVITLIALLITIGVTMGGRERITILEDALGQVVTPIQKGVKIVDGVLEAIFDPIVNVWKNDELVSSLEEENQALKEQLVEVTLDVQAYQELKELEKVFNFLSHDQKQNFVAGRIIAKDPSNWYNMFTIDIGSKDGVVKNSTVVNGDGLIGLVYEVGTNWSKVISIIDNKSSIGFEILHPTRNFDGVIQGSVDFELGGTLYDPKATVREGDMLITSGTGIYPSGLIIGTVQGVKLNDNDLLTEVKVSPAVNFKQLNRVVVIPYQEVE